MSTRAGKAYLGRGIYTLPQASRLLRIHPNTLRHWLGVGPSDVAVIHRELEDEGLLSFAELMELQFIKMFSDEGVSLPTIRRAASEASKRFRTNHPFSVQKFDTDGKSIFATLVEKANGSEVVEELRHGQRVFGEVIRPFFRKLKYQGGQVSEFWPLETAGRIVLDPQRRLGEPIDAETGVPTETIRKALKAGGGQEEAAVAAWYGIPIEAVRAAVSFEESLAA